jgi:hypothetical protein
VLLQLPCRSWELHREEHERMMVNDVSTTFCCLLPRSTQSWSHRQGATMLIMRAATNSSLAGRCHHGVPLEYFIKHLAHAPWS